MNILHFLSSPRLLFISSSSFSFTIFSNDNIILSYLHSFLSFISPFIFALFSIFIFPLFFIIPPSSPLLSSPLLAIPRFSLSFFNFPSSFLSSLFSHFSFLGFLFFSLPSPLPFPLFLPPLLTYLPIPLRISPVDS